MLNGALCGLTIDIIEKESIHMKQSAIRKRVIGFTVLGLSIVAVPAVAMASSPSSSPTATTATTVKATTTTTLPKTTTTLAKTATTVLKNKTTTTAPKTTKTYEVIAGTFTTKAAATKRLKAINAKKITGLTIVQIGKTKIKYRLETTGLTKAKAIAAVKLLKSDKFFAYYVVN